MQSFRTISRPTILAGLMAALIYEILNHFVFPHLTGWQIHLTTICAIVFASALPAFYLARRYAKFETQRARIVSAIPEQDRVNELNENTLPQDANLLDALIRTSPVAIAVADKNHKVTLINPAFSRIFGYTPEDCVGRGVRELIVPLEGEASFQENADFVLSGNTVRGTMTRKTKNGTLVYVESYAVPVFASGEQCGIVAVYQDVTLRVIAEDALRQSEEVFRMLSATAPVGIFRTDPLGTPVYVNSRLTEITGITAEQSLANRWSDSIHPEDRARTLERWIKAVQTGEDLIDEHRVVKPDGEIVWVAIRARWARESDGKLQSFVGVIEDITAIRDAHEKMRQAKEAAEAASQTKSEFLANMSHEIRTPLNGVVGMTDLALETELTQEQREYLDTVKLSADALLTVINDILDFSKIEAGKIDLEALDFGIRDGLEATLKTLAVRSDEKGLELLCEIAPEVPEVVCGDFSRLRQIVVNLLGNAIKFTDEGEVALKVDIESQTDASCVLHFTVSDTGIGIPAEKQESIFEAFSQADNSTTRKYGGTGLGLSISMRLVAMMGGKIWVRSETGRGSQFHFTVRMGVADSKPVEVGSVAPPEILRGVKTLIVDDNPTNRRILEGMLKRWEMKSTSVEGGVAALSRLSEAQDAGEPYALVVTDMHMPEMDGFTLIERIRQRPELSAAIVMMLTSAGHRGDAARCQELGISAYLLKPIRQSELREAMARVLGAPEKSGAIPLVTRYSLGDARDPSTILRVLLAEDNAVNQRLASRLLEKRGHRVQVVANGREALAVLEKETFDLIFMDVQMPEMDGFEATAAIRKKEQGSGIRQPIIALTAHAMKGDRERCVSAGMDGYLSKPIRVEELDEILEKYVARRAEVTNRAEPLLRV
jgi:PAS domain S-box-containing protein